MKLYLLKPIKDDSGPWKNWYDKAFGFVIFAESEANARKIASEWHGDEGSKPWLDPSLTYCKELTTCDRECVVLESYMSA